MIKSIELLNVIELKCSKLMVLSYKSFYIGKLGVTLSSFYLIISGLTATT